MSLSSYSTRWAVVAKTYLRNDNKVQLQRLFGLYKSEYYNHFHLSKTEYYNHFLFLTWNSGLSTVLIGSEKKLNSLSRHGSLYWFWSS